MGCYGMPRANGANKGSMGGVSRVMQSAMGCWLEMMCVGNRGGYGKRERVSDVVLGVVSGGSIVLCVWRGALGRSPSLGLLSILRHTKAYGCCALGHKCCNLKWNESRLCGLTRHER